MVEHLVSELTDRLQTFLQFAVRVLNLLPWGKLYTVEEIIKIEVYMSLTVF